MTSKEIRQQFIDYFRSKEHAIVPSSPVVPHDDPTLMFTNAGMNQFKPIFLGTVAPNSEFARLKRAANSQKCIRAGGKHNDLDDVGQDTYHHTFFEMLGNWSFGDYFKKEAIEWAWELLTKVWGIDKTRLHATYFQGDLAEGLEPDKEAAELWRTVTDINPKHIHPGNKKDNFWEMGDTGPCGPCSEVHIDLTPDKSGRELVNKGDARVMEIWNLVFIQFNRGSDSKLTPLPAKHVDTGMGFERLCAVLQATQGGQLRPGARVSNYDTDVFAPVFAAIQKRTAAPDYTGTLPGDSRQSTIDNRQLMVDVSYRVIADHIRCLTFALTDGAVPSNEGRGYVLRRILRRAVRYGRQYLNMHEPFLCDLVEPLVNHMGDAFPELRSAHRGKNVEHVKEIIRDEEASFLKTLDRGIKLFTEAADFARNHHHGKISGEDAFKLHDTYGFPIDLTELMAEEERLTIDIGEYQRLMEEAKERARSVAKQSLISNLEISGATQFKGYENLKMHTMVEAIFRDSQGLNLLNMGEQAALVIASSPFYAEQGGQVGDTGVIRGRDASWEFQVLDTKKLGSVFVHYGQCSRGQIRRPLGGLRYGESALEYKAGEMDADVSAQATAEVNAERRDAITKNHTSTHLLNWALREVLCPAEERENPHVQQKGSLVDPEKTRFDFSHNKPVAPEELDKIESLVNERIKAGLKVYTNSNVEVDQAKARQINTLRAVFGEKYPDYVRVVSIGVPVTEEEAKGEGRGGTESLLGNPKNAKWMNYSVEFCGGTHVDNTEKIEKFVLTHEEGVAKGVRRVVGISGTAAKQAESLGNQLLAEVDALAGKPPVAPGNQTPPTPPLVRGGEGTTPAGQSPPLAKGGRGGVDTSTDIPLAERLSSFQQRLIDAEIPLRVRNTIRDRLADLQKLVKEEGKQAAAASGEAVQDAVANLLAAAQTVGGVTVVVGEVPPASPDALRSAVDWVRNKTPASAVLLAYVSDGKVTLMAGMSKAVVEKGIKAGDLIKEITPLVGGKGGGRPDMAQGGGPDAAGVPNALAQAATWVRQKLA